MSEWYDDLTFMDIVKKYEKLEAESAPISKREQFAMAAMQGYCSSAVSDLSDVSGKLIAECAVLQADELIKQLKETKA